MGVREGEGVADPSTHRYSTPIIYDRLTYMISSNAL